MSIPYAEEPTTSPRAKTPVKIAIVVCCALVASMWIYYFVFATDEGVYQVQDRTWRVAASEICSAASIQREALSDVGGGIITQPTAEQMLQRAVLVDKATDILEQMVTDLAAIPVDNGKDATRVEFFVKNYRIVLSDRRRYTSRLRAGENAKADETVVGGGPVSNVVSDFTAGVKGNNVPECTPPDDLRV